MKLYLFVGGPRDGQRIICEGRPTMMIPSGQPRETCDADRTASAKIEDRYHPEVYKLNTIVADHDSDKDVHIYVHQSMDVEDAIHSIVNGYCGLSLAEACQRSDLKVSACDRCKKPVMSLEGVTVHCKDCSGNLTGNPPTST